MMKKRILKVMAGVLAILVFWAGALALSNYLLITNVFDEMYYAGKTNFPFGPTRTSFDNLTVFRQQVNPLKHTWYYAPQYVQPGEAITIYLITEKAKDTEKIEVKMLKEHVTEYDELAYESGKAIVFSLQVDLAPQTEEERVPSLYISYNYFPSESLLVAREVQIFYQNNGYMYITDPNEITKYLLAYDVSREDIRGFQEYLLHEKIIPDWLEGNGRVSKFSLEYLGDYELIDDTFSQLGVNF